jgi:hypothetical protein
MDWRGALARLRRSSVRSILMPMVDRLAPGQRVLLIAPIKLPTTPLWLDLIDRYSMQWERALEHDRSLKRIVITTAGSGGSGLGVQASLFVKRGLVKAHG